MKKSLNIILIFSIFLFGITGCSFRKEENTLEDKITEEINYMENELVGIVNNFTLGKYLEDSEKNILDDTRKLEEASNRIMVDLAAENIDNGEIAKLGDGINNMITLGTDNLENEYLVELNNVFSLLPNFEAKVSNDSDEIFECRLKYFTISSYISYVVGDKELAKTQVTNLDNEFLEKQKSTQYVEEHKYNMNKIYLLIQELKKGIEQDSDALVKEKYLLLVDEI